MWKFTKLGAEFLVPSLVTMKLIYCEYTDKELVARLRVGDEAALTEIYERYWDKLFVVSVNRIGNQHEAEECVQDVMHKLWLLREKLTIENEDLGGYLAVAVRNQVFNRRLKHHRARLQAEGYVAVESRYPSPEQELIARELAERIDKAINTLPTQCRIVFELKQKEGLTTKEIAGKLNVSENTVKYHLKKANRDIRDNLDVIGLFALFYQLFQK